MEIYINITNVYKRPGVRIIHSCEQDSDSKFQTSITPLFVNKIASVSMRFLKLLSHGQICTREKIGIYANFAHVSKSIFYCAFTRILRTMSISVIIAENCNIKMIISHCLE